MKNDFNYYISIYFKDYLPNVLGVSKNTLLSYRDTFSLLLIYLRDKQKLDIKSLKFEDLSYDIICEFLLYLEEERKNSVHTRNQRLGAIHSFYNFLKLRELSHFDLCSKILSIPFKKAPKNTISYFSTEEISILINSPNTLTKSGFRDYVLLLFMYETAARASEISNLKRNQLFIQDSYSYVILVGKGNKSRNIPITQDLANILKEYFSAFHIELDNYMFTNKKKEKITTKGIEYILFKYIGVEKNKKPNKFQSHYSNHSMRHSKAMHLLESGVNLIYIRDFLGHVSVTTTEIYAKTNPIIKEKQILEHSQSLGTIDKYDTLEKESLLDFLKTL